MTFILRHTHRKVIEMGTCRASNIYYKNLIGILMYKPCYRTHGDMRCTFW